MSNYEKIKEACIKANPEIMELKFGCEVVWVSPANEETNTKAKEYKATVIRNWGNGAVSILDKVHPNITQATYTVLDRDFKEILGRPIRLADVLLAIENKLKETGKQLAVESSGLLTGNFFDWENDQVYFWNLLKDDLSLQTPETQEFIASLL